MPLPRPLPTPLPFALPVLLGVVDVAALFTNVGQNSLATAIQTPSANTAITFVDISLGCGTLSSGLTNGQTGIISLPLDVGLAVGLASGQSLTIFDGTNSQTVTTSGAVAPFATSIPVNSFTASATFAAHTTGIAPTPLVGDIALYNNAGAVRVAANTGVAGANPGESLNSGYFDGTQATGVYMIVGYFGGASATSTPGTGVLIAEDVQYWNHVQNAESATFQLDSVI